MNMATKKATPAEVKTVWIDNRSMANRIVAITHQVDGKEQRIQQFFVGRTMTNKVQGRTEIPASKWKLFQDHRDQWEHFHSDDAGCFLRECTPAETQADIDAVKLAALSRQVEEQQRARGV